MCVRPVITEQYCTHKHARLHTLTLTCVHGTRTHRLSPFHHMNLSPYLSSSYLSIYLSVSKIHMHTHTFTERQIRWTQTHNNMCTLWFFMFPWLLTEITQSASGGTDSLLGRRAALISLSHAETAFWHQLAMCLTIMPGLITYSPTLLPCLTLPVVCVWVCLLCMCMSLCVSIRICVRNTCVCHCAHISHENIKLHRDTPTPALRGRARPMERSGRVCD